MIALAAVAVLALVSAIPDLNPFGTETRDRSQPPLLKSLQRLSEYRAATANMQVVVDIEQDDKILPSFLKGRRTLLVAAGNVDAGVSFAKLDDGNVVVSADRRTVTVDLPRAVLSPARLDLRRTRVYDQQRGVLDRVGDLVSENPDEQRALLAEAQEKLTQAAREDPQLLAAAERNTRAMLENLLRGLGFERVTVRFPPPAT